MELEKVDEYALKTPPLFDFKKYDPRMIENRALYSAGERTALERYKRMAYKDMNWLLRTDKMPRIPYGSREIILKDVTFIDGAIKKTSLPRGLPVFRGISPKVADNIMKNGISVDAGFSSVTADSSMGIQFAEAIAGPGRTKNMMVWKYKKGTKAVMWDYEKEILVPRGLKLRCIGIKEVSKLNLISEGAQGKPISNVRLFMMQVEP